MSLPYRRAIRTVSDETLLQINAKEQREGDSRFQPFSESISSIEAAHAPSDTILRVWAAHPDERVPIALLKSWNRHLGTSFLDELNETIWEALTTHALRDAANEGVWWTPLLDAIAVARETSPVATGSCDYWESLGKLQRWTRIAASQKHIEAMLDFKFYLVREPAALRLALLEPSRIPELRQIHLTLASEILLHPECDDSHIDELAALAVEDIRRQDLYIPAALPPFDFPMWSRDTAFMAVVMLRNVASQNRTIHQRHVEELAHMALSGTATTSGRGVSMAARRWSLEALLNLGRCVPEEIVELLYDAKVRRAELSQEAITRFALHPRATLRILSNLVNRLGDGDLRAWDDLAEAKLVQETPSLRRHVAMRASFTGLRSLADFCDANDWRAIFRRYSSTQKGHALLQNLLSVLAMARRDQLELIEYAEWRRFLRVPRCDIGAAAHLLSMIPSACRHPLGQQQIIASRNVLHWLTVLPEMNGDAARELFQKLATESPEDAAEVLQNSPHILADLQATDLLPLLACEDDQLVREAAMEALAVVGCS